MEVAVVILNWNGKALLEQFVPALITHSPHANLYVADNASTDDSIAFLSANFPQISIIQNTTNGGYARGYNEALRQLSEPLLVLLNSDVEVTPNWLNPVVEQFLNDDTIAAAQPKILDYNKKTHFEYAGAAGGFIDKYGFPYCRGRIFNTLEEDNRQYDTTFPIFWASGACLFVRAKDFWEVGGFDEDYFAHQEEIDLCWRLNARGKKIVCVGQSIVYHVGGATLDASHPNKTFLNFRNSLFNLYKNKRSGVFSTLFIRLSMDGLAGVQFLFQGKPLHCLAIIRAHFSFYASLRKMRNKRRQFASNSPYFVIKSIVFHYFIKKNRKFSAL